MNFKRLSSPKAIFFDWDGTLVDSYAFLEGAHNHVMRELYNKELLPGEFRHYFGRPRDFVYSSLYGPQAQQAQRLFTSYVENSFHEVRQMPGADKLLRTAVKLGVPLGVISNKKKSFILQECHYLGWNDIFHVIFGAGDAAADKPDAAPFEAALKCLESNIEKKSFWYVGDSEIDMQASAAFACPFILVGHDMPFPERTTLKKPDLTLKNCQQFQEYLLQYLQN